MKKIIIAIDGFSSSGKSTMAKDLARKVGYVYVDSGAMYRAVTLYALENGIANPATKELDRGKLTASLPDIKITFSLQSDGTQHTMLNGRDVEREIRGMEVSSMVSPVAEIPEVRHQLVALQQSYGKDGGIVMDGRDIGTTVFPQAEMKVFVNASAEVRAKRRYKELLGKGEPADYEAVLRNVNERDLIDTTREESPLRQADDAFVFDNSCLTRERQLEILLGLFKEITGGELEISL